MRKLFSLDPKEVSLVTRAANKKKFLITKAHGEVQMNEKEIQTLVTTIDKPTLGRIDKILKAFGMKKDESKDNAEKEIHVDIDSHKDESEEGGEIEKEESAPLSDRAQAALKAVARILAPFKEEIKDEHLDAIQQELGMMEGKDEELEKGQMAQPQKEISKEHSAEAMEEAKKAYKSHLEKLGYRKYPDEEVAQKSKSVLDEGDDEEEEDVSKEKVAKSEVDLSAFPKEQRTHLEMIFKSNAELVTKNADLEKQLNAEREARIQKEFSERAAQFKHLGDTNEIAAILKSLSEKDPEAFKKTETILKTANDQIAKGELFKELGTRTGGSVGDAEGRLNALVDSVVQKSGNTKTKEQIYAEVLESSEGRKLYSDMMNSRPGGI